MKAVAEYQHKVQNCTCTIVAIVPSIKFYKVNILNTIEQLYLYFSLFFPVIHYAKRRNRIIYNKCHQGNAVFMIYTHICGVYILFERFDVTSY